MLGTLQLPEPVGTDEQQRHQGCRESENEALGNGHDGKFTHAKEARHSTPVQLQDTKRGEEKDSPWLTCLSVFVRFFVQCTQGIAVACAKRFTNELRCNS